MELELRLTILAIGLIIIAFIYLWGIRHRIKEIWADYRQRRPAHRQNKSVTKTEMKTETQTIEYASDDDEETTDLEPAGTLADKTDALVGNDRASSAGRRQEYADDGDDVDDEHGGDDRDDLADEDERPNILILVIAPREKPFQGADILQAAQELELQLNDKGTWSYCPDKEAVNAAAFRVGHLKEPGNFDMQTINTMTTPGLVLFIQLPGPIEALAAVDRMIGIAGQLAEKLGGSVRDDHGHKMTPQLMSHLRAQAAEYDRRLRLRNL
jgi:cell division protein ZipA